MVDAVPAFRKAGVLGVAGMVYEPDLDLYLRQRAAVLTVAEGAGVFALAPERGEVAFDQVQLSVADADVEVWPFVITAAGELMVFADSSELEICETGLGSDEPFAAFSVEGDVDGSLAFEVAMCAALSAGDGMVNGELPSPVTGVRSFGLLVSGVSEPGTEISVGWLAIGLSTVAAPLQQIHVSLVRAENSLSARSADSDDDASLTCLHVPRDDGTEVIVETGDAMGFTLAREQLGARAKLWIADFRLEHYVQQGPWIDPERLTYELVIDMLPIFVETGESPAPSDVHRRPHALQIWNGWADLEQQFYGLTWNNNLGLPDRDCDPDNPNGCARSAYFGGSWVGAGQTRVDQKPGLIAEALLAMGSDTCHEVFTVGQTLFSVANHAANARLLVEDYGVTHLIFSFSANEACRHHDMIYADNHCVSPQTPIHWRQGSNGADFVHAITRQPSFRPIRSSAGSH
ncbi:MAG: hypothetical protein GWP48_07730 [Actinobacteria bacterium]|nr:hypothetical protein [Actinomycetota bacterium]